MAFMTSALDTSFADVTLLLTLLAVEAHEDDGVSGSKSSLLPPSSSLSLAKEY